VLTLEHLGRPEELAALRAFEPELIVVADYGRLLPAELLALPEHGALNLHPSLLPRWRGASPVAAAILAGDDESGVSLMRLDVGLDTGPIVAQRRLLLDGRETSASLEAELAEIAAALLTASLGPWLRGELGDRAQDPALATLSRPLRRADGQLDPAQPARALERRVRAYQPWPGAHLDLPTGRLLIRAAALGPDPSGPEPRPERIAPGTIVADADGIALTTPDGRLRLLRVQPAGGRTMTGAELRRGRPSLVGSVVAGPKQPPTVA
ncbi:MAG: methionyl-tRNA formyltransferase, partial [Candidatus Limnocylindrales bacterium]